MDTATIIGNQLIHIAQLEEYAQNLKGLNDDLAKRLNHAQAEYRKLSGGKDVPPEKSTPSEPVRTLETGEVPGPSVPTSDPLPVG